MNLDANRTTLMVAAGAGIVVAGYLGWKLIHSMRGEPIKVVETISLNKATAKALVDCTDKTAYFLQEMRLGEQCLSLSDFDAGIDHLANALLVCDKRDQLESVLKTSLPQPIYDKVQKAFKEKEIEANSKVTSELKAESDEISTPDIGDSDEPASAV